MGENNQIKMKQLWTEYQASLDIVFLAEAAEAAPFFGQKEMAQEIGRILRDYKSLKNFLKQTKIHR